MVLIRLIVLCFLLQACAVKTEANPQITTLYYASSDVNPDVNNRPSPIVVSSFQLKTITAFSNAGFFQLYNDAKNILNENLISEHQQEISPDQELTTTVDLLPDTRYIGVIAAYRDIDNAKWKVIIPVRNSKSLNFSVHLNKNILTVQQQG